MRFFFYFLYYPKVMDLKSNKTNEHLAQVKCLVCFCCVSAEVIIHTFRPHVIRIGFPRHIRKTGVLKLCGIVVPPDQVAIPDALNPYLRSIRRALFLCQKRCEQSGFFNLLVKYFRYQTSHRSDFFFLDLYKNCNTKSNFNTFFF